jgi:tetratricopeptide (TPR) repeat protein
VLLHRVVAQLLEQQAAGETHERNAHLAEHYERGKVWPRALHYLVLAADRSQKLFAMRESLRWFDRAIALLQAHPDAATAEQQLTLYERRGAARAQAGQTDGAVADFQRAIGAARALGQHEHARDVLIQLGMAYRRADAYEQAVACLDEALTASRATGDERHAADTLYHLGTVAWSNGRNDLAISCHQEAVDICERLQLRDLVAVQAFHGRGEAYFAHGEPAAAIASFSRSLDLARAIGDRSYESENLMMIGWACSGHMGLADYPRALSHLDAALEIARAADLQWHLGPTRVGRAHALAALGRFGEACAELKEALPRLQALGLVRYQMMAHDAMGCLLLDLNSNGEAAQHFERGLGLAVEAGIRYWLARLQANLAIARVRAGSPCDREALAAARQTAQEHSETWLTVRCLQALSEAALLDGNAAAALAHADTLLAQGSGGQMRELIGQARRLRGLAHLALGEPQAAREELLAALAVAEQIGCVRLAWDCHQGLARGHGADVAAHRARAAELAGRMSRSLGESGLTCDLQAQE